MPLTYDLVICRLRLRLAKALPSRAGLPHEATNDQAWTRTRNPTVMSDGITIGLVDFSAVCFRARLLRFVQAVSGAMAEV
jgi:hypothetical protein